MAVVANKAGKPEHTRARLLLAHGAGAPMDSDFMSQLAAALESRGVEVLRFEFPYMLQRRTDGVRRPPNPMPALLEAFRQHYQDTGQPLFIGGKSLGGRVASLLAEELPVSGLLCFGYPFHPPGKSEKTRTDHLAALHTPTLIIQGTRDPFGKPEEVSNYILSEQIQVSWLDTGDHDFKPLKRSGLTQAELINQAAVLAAEFIRQHS